MHNFCRWKTTFLACVFCVVGTMTSPAQTFQTLANFDGTDGYDPLYEMYLVQGLDGNLYGTTSGGGAHNQGTVFKITATGTLTTLYSFCSKSDCADGYQPYAGLIQGTDGDFYGTTTFGGASSACSEVSPPGCGTVFKITPAGKLTTLHHFDLTDGATPFGGLIQGTDGNFYGTTSGGFTGGVDDGTVFKMTPAGKVTTLHSFDGTDGASPWAGLIQGTDGNFYGTTRNGGLQGYGTVFKITPTGTLTTLYSFCSQSGCADGYFPAGLVQATNGNFYGTISGGGVSTTCTGCGTVFKITTAGTLTTLHTFDGADGMGPTAGLIQATDGNFYGTTAGGGETSTCGGCGTVFKITPAGILTTLENFDLTDGSTLYAGLVQATNGDLYGTTSFGGAFGAGTVFSLSVGLGPFVEILTASGKVGAAVTILGNDLRGATSVTFNTTVAKFEVVSSTEIKTTVPSPATTGKVKVVTPSRTLTSNLKFRVTPTILSFSPTSGPVDTSVVITGKSFTGATSVAFGGVKATSFEVDSYTQVTATVPSGAKTGEITVTTPGGTVTSTGTFTVP